MRLTLPPWKIGVKRLGVTCQTLESAFRRFEKSPLIVPRRPVSEMVGKKRALAAPTLALAATRSCSAPSTSGRRSRSEVGRPAGIAGGTVLVRERRAARDRAREPAEQERERVLRGRDLPLELRDRPVAVRARFPEAWSSSSRFETPPFKRAS